MKLVALRSNHASFRTVTFHDGLNVVLAERTQASAETDSRNGVGKTTLLQAIDFCLGGSTRPGDSLSKLVDQDWAFTLDLAFGDAQLSVTREVDDPSSLRLEGDVVTLQLGEASPMRIGSRTWTTYLGQVSFGLGTGPVVEEYAPTFRRLIGHFVRFRADGYLSPFETFSRQPPHQVQVDNAYLLRLDWRLAVEWQRLKDRDKALGALARSDQEEIAERLGELESRRVRAEAQHRRLSQDLRVFEVLPEYREVEERANRLTEHMQRLANERTLTARAVEQYRESLAQDAPETGTAVEELFREAGVHFGDDLRRSLSEVRIFHAQVTINRRDYLAAEIRRLEALQEQREQQLRDLGKRRRDEMQLLESKGALEDFATLQQRLGSLASSIEAMTSRIDELRDARKGKAALKVAQVELQERTSRDVEERLATVAPVLEQFSDVFEALYGVAADLSVDVGEAGYRFRAHLPREGSHGVGKMAVFAYDLAVTSQWSISGRGPGFLVHDSVIFDGVDERQTASAIGLAAQRAAEDGYQYLLTLNSDDLSTAELRRIRLNLEEVTVLTLTDHDASGGLLGVRL